MISFNNGSMLGNLTKDPYYFTKEVNGVAVPYCIVRVAVSSRSGKDEDTEYFNVIGSRGAAESMKRSLKKGDLFGVTGEIHLRTTEYKGKTYANMQFTYATLHYKGVPADDGQVVDAVVTDEDDEIPFDA